MQHIDLYKKKYVELMEKEEKLYWIDRNADFSNKDKFALPDNEHIELMIKQVGLLLNDKILEI